MAWTRRRPERRRRPAPEATASSPAPRLIARALLGVGLIAPFGVVALGAQACSESLAVGFAKRIHGVAEPLAPLGCGESRLAEWLWPTARCSAQPLPLAELRLLEDAPVPFVTELPIIPVGPPPPAIGPSPSGPKRSAPRGLLVREARVRAAARSGARPVGSPVAAAGRRPAGLALYGVSALGLGLRDGDVLTRAAGAAATSAEAVINAVTAAVHRGDPVVTGEVWRGTDRMVITVEIPPSARPTHAERSPQ